MLHRFDWYIPSDSSTALAALYPSQIAHDQRLSSAHISCDKYMLYVCLISVFFCRHISSVIYRHLKSICHIRLTSQKSGCNQYQIRLKFLFAFPEPEPSAFFRTSSSFSLYQLCNHCLFDVSFSSPMNSSPLSRKFWIPSKYRYRFLLPVICLFSLSATAAMDLSQPVLRRLRHHFQLRDRFCSKPDSCSHTVISSISSPDHQYMFSLC